jgi:hypothetical protein
MYNLMHGYGPATFLILPMLGHHPDKYPRFRDCSLGAEGTETEGSILVYTRVGGGNREAYSDEIEWMRSLPTYVDDYDDDFDSTYATFVFHVPEEWKKDLELVLLGNLRETSEAYRKLLYETFPTAKEPLDKVFREV